VQATDPQKTGNGIPDGFESGIHIRILLKAVDFPGNSAYTEFRRRYVDEKCSSK
jgi:hypothetical protein